MLDIFDTTSVAEIQQLTQKKQRAIAKSFNCKLCIYNWQKPLQSKRPQN
ncbi:hypothetical protein [Komarekiella delphini-convector]|nr:hypothetical protein [Komarekiella delphini-convector]